MIPVIYCMYENTVNFPCRSQIHFGFKNTLKNAIQTNKGGKILNHLLPLGVVDPI